MAYTTHGAQRAHGSLFSRIAEARASLNAYLARRALYKRTLHEMQVLSDRELADLGLHRSELPRVAWQAAQEA